VVAAERNSNYGFCLSVWDRLFGSYVPEPAGGQSALRIGFPGFTDPTVSTTFLGVLGIPFRAERTREAGR
jgi:sterol desaturase/sphingolipid hydroxylase (fatty acid hydroxylase superfamily)